MNTLYLLPIVLSFPFILLAILHLAQQRQSKMAHRIPIKTVYTAQGKVIKALYNGRYVTVKTVNKCKIRRI